MKPARFSYAAPHRLDEALAMLTSHEDAKILAGGQSLVPMMNMRVAQPGLLIDINAVEGLDFVREEGGGLVAGPLVRHHDLARHPLILRHCPILAEAAGTIGHYAIRQRGTLGGSLAHADPAAQLPLIACLLDAEIELASAERRRRVRAGDFFEAPLTTAIELDEVIAAVHWPKLDGGDGWSFRLFSRRCGDFAIVAAAVLIPREGHGRIAFAGIGPRPAVFSLEHGLDFIEAAEIEDDPLIEAVYRRELMAGLGHSAYAEASGRRS